MIESDAEKVTRKPTVNNSHKERCRLDLFKQWISLLGDNTPFDKVPIELIAACATRDAKKLGLWQRPNITDVKRTVTDLEPITYGCFHYNPRDRLLTITGHQEPIQLSIMEATIMHELIKNGGVTIPYELLLKAYKSKCSVDDPDIFNVRIYITYLRKKIGDKAEPAKDNGSNSKTKAYRYIKNVLRYGYRLDDPDLKKSVPN